ncbi:MAG: hypothetical protein QXV85_09440 [Candidatus Bathyarchaeia archaeon]
MSLKDFEKIPWFAIAGALVILNLLMVSQTADFMSLVVPSYLTQAFLYIALGYGFLRGHTEQGFAVFLMSGIWLLTNILLWSNVVNAAWLWLLFIAQLGLIYMFFTGQNIKFAGSGGITWTYAALWIVFLFGLGKFIIGLNAGLTFAQMPLWGLGILLMSLGYIIEPVEKSWATPLQAIGCLLALISALTLTTPGLQLLP